jgi:cytosine/adenosine deaminase-related metal-dependent hydrolase
MPAWTSEHAELRRHGGPLIIEAGWVLAYREGALTLLRDHSVVVPRRPDRRGLEGRRRGRERRLNARRHLLLPGFISGHTHVAGGTATRGIIEGGRSFARPLVLADALSDDDLDALTAFNLAELLRSGCTTQLEMALSLKQAESYVRVARHWGVRGYPGGMIPGSTGCSRCGSARATRRCWTPSPTRWRRSRPTAPSGCATTARRTGGFCRR